MTARIFSRSIFRWIGFSVVAGAIALFTTDSAVAQVGLSPMVMQSEVNRGQAQGVLTVANPSSEPMRVRMYAEPFTYDRVDGFVILEEDANDLTPYLQFSPREFVVPPGEAQRVRVVGLLPPSLAESEYRAVIFTEALPESLVQGQSTAGIQTRVGSTTYFRRANLSPNFSIVQAQWNKEESQAQLLLGNAGEATARPNVQWQIRQNGEEIASGQSGEMTVIEGSDRIVPLRSIEEEQTVLSPGEYEVMGELVWLFDSQRASQPFSTTLVVQ